MGLVILVPKTVGNTEDCFPATVLHHFLPAVCFWYATEKVDRCKENSGTLFSKNL